MAGHRSDIERKLSEMGSIPSYIGFFVYTFMFFCSTHVSAQTKDAPTYLEDLGAIVAQVLGNGTNPEYATYYTGGTFAQIWGQPLYSNAVLESKYNYTNLFSYQTTLSSSKLSVSVPVPNVDTLYGGAYLDLSDSPMVLSLPKYAHQRYWSVAFFDAYAEVIGVNSSRTNGEGPTTLVFVGPNFRSSLPESLKSKIIFCGGNTLSIELRVLVNHDTGTDLKKVLELMREVKLQTLSEYNGGPPTPRSHPFQLTSLDYLSPYLKRLVIIGMGLVKNPPKKTEANNKAVAQLSEIGLNDKTGFNPDGLNSIQSLGLNNGYLVANISSYLNFWRGVLVTNSRNSRNRWNSNHDIYSYGEGFYLRAAATRDYGIGALPPEEAIYFFTVLDESYRYYQGSDNHTLHLLPPPCIGFWSLTLYNTSDEFLPENLTKYSVGDRTQGLVYNENGTVIIYLQPNSPGPKLEPNWLPTPPNTPFTLWLRAYQPREIVKNGTYWPNAVIKVVS